MKLLDDFRFWLGKRIMGKTVVRLLTTENNSCSHDWKYETSHRRICTICGELQIKSYHRFGDIRCSWGTAMHNSNKSLLP